MPENIEPEKSGRMNFGIRHYLPEGLMLFIAVALGFISENVREGIVERNTTRELAQNMITDLQSDTANLKGFIEYFSEARTYVDSLNALLLREDLDSIPNGKLYFYGLFGGARRLYVSNDAAFQQLRSSGLLRRIADKSIRKRILDYERINREVSEEAEWDNLLYVEVRKVRGLIFDYRFNREANEITLSIRNQPDSARLNTFLNADPPLLTSDPVLFNQYMELVRSRNFARIVNRAARLHREATDLIQALEAAY